MLKCITCKEMKPEEAYSPSRRHPGTRCKSCAAEQSRKYRARMTPFEQKVANVCRIYKITPEQYMEMFLGQIGKCAICEKGMVDDLDNFHLDHNEETGQVRALLCGPCNRGIGMFKHDENLLLAAAAYIMQHKPVETETRRTN